MRWQKKIPTEQFTALYNKMACYSPRHPDRKRLVEDFSLSFGVSESTVRRQLREHIHYSETMRADKNLPRLISKTEMLRYCRVIAALKVRTTNKKGTHLSTAGCIRILEDPGVETAQGLVKAPKGLLKKTTVNRYLKNWGYDVISMKVEPAAVRFEAEYSNDCWQFDFTPSDLKKSPSNKEQKLFIANITDDKSGVLYCEYVQSDGEDALTALRFLFNAMSAKKAPGFTLQGIPKLIYTDNGAFAKSGIFKRTLAALGIELKTHLPKGKDGRRTTARSKGKIERANRTVKSSFETLFHLHQPESLEQINDWVRNYLLQYNDMSHRSDKCSRIEAWSRFLPESGYREMCSWEKFCQIVREPEVRKVASDGCLSVEGIQYQLATDMAGLIVTLQHGVFDNELYVELNGKTQGPFYPFSGPIPLHTYRTPVKNQREKQADEITSLANSLSVPISMMTGKFDDAVVKQLKRARAIQHQVCSVPFEDKQDARFKNRLEAKQAISQYLCKPLATLSATQLNYIDQVVTESLDKQEVLTKVKQYFSLSLCKLGEK